MPNEKETTNANFGRIPAFVISGRIESSDQVAVSRDNLPIINTLIRGKAPDEYTNPPQWAVTSNIRFGKQGDIVTDIKTEVRCRSYLIEQVDERTGVVSKIRRFTHDLWLAQ